MTIPVEIDETNDVVTVYGIRYSGLLFRTMALAEPGTWMRIEGRNNGTISVFMVNDVQARTFDVITGLGRACVS